MNATVLKYKETLLDFPLYILSRPFKGFDEMKSENRGSMTYAMVILVLLGLVGIWQEMYLGFVVSGFWWDVQTANVVWILIFTYAPIGLVCLANWSITSVTNGNGKMREIFLVYCYALFPTIFLRMLGVALSNFVTLNESAFVVFLFVFAQVLLYFYIFLGWIVIHEYTFLRAVFTVILTILAMLIIVFIMALFVSLVSEFINFVYTIIYEIDAHLI